MPEYRRAFLPGGTFFFTLVTERRARILCTPIARPILRAALEAAQHRWPFEIRAIVLLPDHLHTLWTLPKAIRIFRFAGPSSRRNSRRTGSRPVASNRH
jgi:REP element-mobilizing transposase RayT